MPRWSYAMTDTRTGEIRAEHVAMSGVKWSDSLDQGGTLTGTVRWGDPKFSANMADDLWRRVIWPCRYGRPMGAFVLTSLPNADMSSPVQQIQCTHVANLAANWELYDDLNFTTIDQLDIFRDLLRYGLGIRTQFSNPIVGSDATKNLPWMRLGDGTSGVLRTRQVTTSGASDEGYPGTSGKFIGPLVKALSELGAEPGVSVSPGFEYRMDYGIESGQYWAQWTPGYPLLGRGASDPNRIVFEYPSTAVPSASMGSDGSTFATRVRVLGQERDGTRPNASRTNTALLAAGYPLIDRNFTTTDTTEASTLGDKADARLAQASIMNTGYALTLKGDATPVFGTYNLGDHVILRMRRGGVQLSDVTVRITGWSVDITDDMETITPQLSAAE